MPSLNDIKSVGHELGYDSTPERIQVAIDILTEFLADTLSRRGSSIEEYRKARKEVVAGELQVIDEELARVEGPTDPLPPIAP